MFCLMSAKSHKVVEFSATEKLVYGIRNDNFLIFSWQGFGFKCKFEKMTMLSYVNLRIYITPYLYQKLPDQTACFPTKVMGPENQPDHLPKECYPKL